MNNYMKLQNGVFKELILLFRSVTSSVSSGNALVPRDILKWYAKETLN